MMNTLFLRFSMLVICLPALSRIQGQETKFIDHSPGYDIAVYYFPNYHNNDTRNEMRYGKGWSEWELEREFGYQYLEAIRKVFNSAGGSGEK